MDWNEEGILMKRSSYFFHVVKITILISRLLKAKTVLPKRASI